MAAKTPPEGFHTVTPYLIVSDVAQQLTFLRDAMDAREVHSSAGGDGGIIHAQVQIGDSMVMMGRAQGDYPPMPSMLYLYVDDTDAWYRRALAAGATSVAEPKDQDYGDRSGGVKDPQGNQWWFGTPLAG